MTNRSFLFSCHNKKYIMRIPGEGTDQLINRREEAEVYHVIDGMHICDDIAYINPENGYKITEFLESSRVCDSNNVNDLKACMKKLREFHNLNLSVEHEFNIFDQIEFYETLWGGVSSIYRDYSKTKENIFSLKNYIDKHIENRCLTHIDAVPDNFLFTKSGDIRLIDWEYAGMQDPHIDIAMFCIYALYNKRQVDRLINIYFENNCPKEIRMKIYCYIAVSGLLWSNWCEYKRNLGVEFGEYSIRQYRYAKDYYEIVFSLLIIVFLIGGQGSFIIENGFQSLGKMVQSFIELSTFIDPARMSNFPQDWTIYYWAYWMVWCIAAPFFIGNISRGRTIKQTILGGYVFGVGSIIASFVILGNYSLGIQTSGVADFISQYTTHGDLYELILSIIYTMPASKWILVITMLCMIAFYATSFDSIAYTAACYSYKQLGENEHPHKLVEFIWCILLIVLPIALVFSESSMSNIQSISIISAFPIGIIMLMMICGFFKDVRMYSEEKINDSSSK